jgi:hypothetical protein
MERKPIAKLPQDFVKKILDQESFLSSVLELGSSSVLKCWNVESDKLRHAATVYLNWDGEYLNMKLCVIKWAQRYVDATSLDALGFERVNPVGTVWTREFMTNPADAANYLRTALDSLIGVDERTGYSVDIEGVRAEFLQWHLGETGWALRTDTIWQKKAA